MTPHSTRQDGDRRQVDTIYFIRKIRDRVPDTAIQGTVLDGVDFKTDALEKVKPQSLLAIAVQIRSRADEFGLIEPADDEFFRRYVRPPGEEPDPAADNQHAEASNDSVRGFLIESRADRARRIHAESLAKGMQPGPGWSFEDGALIPPPPGYGR